eukprot:5795138-Pyramimonas_sp.AAC.1
MPLPPRVSPRWGAAPPSSRMPCCAHACLWLGPSPRRVHLGLAVDLAALFWPSPPCRRLVAARRLGLH